MLMEKAGTGGAAFRNRYRDFLGEAYDLTGNRILKQGHDDFCPIAKQWTKVSSLFKQIADTADRNCVAEVSALLMELSDLEHAAMTKLTAV